MTTHFAYLAATWIFLCGLYGIVTSRNLVHLVICLTVVQSSTYLVFAAIGYRHLGTAPVFVDAPAGHPIVDPIVQALLLTDVVVEATVMALLLALCVQAHKRSGSLDPRDLRVMTG